MQAATAAGHSYSSEEEASHMDDRRQRRDAKRRRVTRKGTHSCWACKRRKEKCSPDPAGGDACHGCRRRGTKCVSQEFPEETSADTRQQHHVSHMGDRMRRIETIVEQLVAKLQNTPPDSAAASVAGSNAPIDYNNPPAAHVAHTGFPTPSSFRDSTRRSPISVAEDDADLPPARPPSATVDTYLASGSLQDLSQALYRSLPSRQDTQLLRQASSRQPTLFGAHITRSYTTLQHCGLKAADGVLGDPPPRTAHPVLIARYMLKLAISLQDMHHEVHPELRHLSETPNHIMERCANAAMILVTNRDELLGSIESLECVTLESVYRCNSGHLRLSWMAVRRAILLAQLMGLHLAEHDTRHNWKILDPAVTHVEPRLLWFRIVSYDLIMCRMLGLPPSTADPCPAPFGANPDTALGHLEHKNAEVMAQILKRRPSASGLPDFESTLLLDQELQRAAKTVPCDWWLAPNLTESSKDPVTLFWDMRRLMTQIQHFDLLNQLYLPFMLAQRQSAMDRQRANLSRIVCVNSSREVLSRFILLRNFNQVASNCRIADFTGLMAAITLVLAHLTGLHQLSDNISSQTGNLLSHQAPSDRAMMEQALKNMRQVSRRSGDAISARSANVLRQLLDIEASSGDSTTGGQVSVYNSPASNNHDTQHTSSNTESTDRVNVPYFGLIKIARQNANQRPTTSWSQRADGNNQSADKATVEPYAMGSGYGPSDFSVPPLNYDALLPGLNDEHMGFPNIQMGFLDNFFDNMPGNDPVYNV